MTYHVVMNKQSGAAVVTTGNPLAPIILFAVGAKRAGQVMVQSGTSFMDTIDLAGGTMGLSMDKIPTKYSPISKGRNYMALTSGIKNAPFNTGSPLSPNITQPQATSFDQTINSIINDTLDFLRLLAWMLNPLNMLRVTEILTGSVFFVVGIHMVVQAKGESRGRFYGYGGIVRRSAIGRIFRQSRHETDVERVRRRGQERQERRGRNTETGRAPNRVKTGSYARSSERANRRADRDTRRNARRSKSR